MVEFVDGTFLAQFSVTDMRLPILYALTYPDRIPSDLKYPVSNLRHLDFEPPDMRKFPCLALAYEAVEAGGGKNRSLKCCRRGGGSSLPRGQNCLLGNPKVICGRTQGNLGRSDRIYISGPRC